jgi:molybdopterin converting factor small subunit
MIVVRLPAMLRQPEMPPELHVDAPVSTIDELVGVLDARYPGLARELDDSIFNFAVNDALVVHHARQHVLHPGDAVEIIPTISGG